MAGEKGEGGPRLPPPPTWLAAEENLLPSLILVKIHKTSSQIIRENTVHTFINTIMEPWLNQTLIKPKQARIYRATCTQPKRSMSKQNMRILAWGDWTFTGRLPVLATSLNYCRSWEYRGNYFFAMGLLWGGFSKPYGIREA